MRAYFQQLAAYNRWANARLLEAALSLGDDEYRRTTGVFFKSMHGTLNHILLTDRIWLKRLTGEGDHPDRLDAELYGDRIALARARVNEDLRIIGTVDSLAPEAFEQVVSYRTTKGTLFEQRLTDILAHLFNHQTHHRGQAHSCYSIVTGREPPTLDLLAFQRGLPAPDLSSALREASPRA